MQRLGDPRRGLAFVTALPAVDLREEHRHDALEELRIAPENVERLIVDLELLAPVEKNARERPVEIVAPLDSGDLQRPYRVEHPVRPDRQPGGAQHPREMHHVLREMSRLRG